MCKFITEVQTQNETNYQPNTLCDIIISIQSYLHSHKMYWKLLPKQCGTFKDLFYIVDNLMKERVARGMGVTKSATPITQEMENKMWGTGILGDHNPNQLLDSTLFNWSKFFIEGGAEHKRLQHPGFNSQFDFHTDSDGVHCLCFTDDAQSKTNQGGLGGRYHAPKVVHAYPNANPARCIVLLFVNILICNVINAHLH